MGQQQLLLVILVTIVIGISASIAINTMQSTKESSEESAIRQDIAMVISDARIYYEKPDMMGGGGNSFDDISEKHILSIDPENENGSYEISGSENSVTVEGTNFNEDIVISATATMTNDGIEISWSETESTE